MPTYEYECTQGHTFEVVQRITADPLKRCKVCRAKAKRLISSANFILKGGGWYSDGYSSGGPKSKSSSSSDSGSSAKSDSSAKSGSSGKSDSSGKSGGSGSSGSD
ncbi:MAG: zinc ribbon domain-containing protein [Deltaproteobacteria bacterium]|nr:zinc ribbon domain-containing protein [Deltaproteobacteria bacterium]MBW2416298.1 zinc ribbon domain-containing protein [Deltaproteobacteria bacterium]